MSHTSALEVIIWDANGNASLDQVFPLGAPPPVPPVPVPPGPPPTGTPTAPAWPSFAGNAQFVGTSPSGRVTVWVDPSLGAPALQNASDLLNDSDRVVQANDKLFGTIGSHVDAIVFALGGATDGTGGADHNGCDYSTGAAIEVCASFGTSVRCSALFEAELSECSMNGQLCGLSTGEALSRWCSMVIGFNSLSDFVSAPTWDQDGRPDFVDTVDPTDQNYDSIGCGMAFLSWVMSLGFTLGQVAVTMVLLGDSGTLANLYATLTSKDAGTAWATFTAALSGKTISNDDPFGALASQLSKKVHLQPGSKRMLPAKK